MNARMTWRDWAIITIGSGAVFGFSMATNPLLIALSWLCVLTWYLHRPS